MVCSVLSMRSTAIAVTLVHPLFVLFFFGAMAKSSAPLSLKSSSDSSSKDSNGYDASICGQDGYSDGSGYSFSSDAWNAEGSGFQCLSVINGSSSTSAGFDATWNWPVSPDTVHSFPHVTFSSDRLPVSLDSISALRLAATWAMTAGNEPPERLGMAADIASVAAKCNVAFDLFLDRDPDKASSAINAGYEIMVWIGRVGQPFPLGWDSQNATCYTQQLGSFNFTLYSGHNSRGTNVYTWMSPTNETAFDEDISPLLQYLWRKELVSADARIGLVEFGSEAYHSEGNVTFSASGFHMDIWKGEPPRFDLNAIGQDCAKPTQPAGPQGTGRPHKSGSGGRPGTAFSSPTVVPMGRGMQLAAGLAAVILWRLCV